MEPGNQNKTELMKTDVESDGEDDRPRRNLKRQKYENSKPNTDTTNDSRYNSCTSVGRNNTRNNNGTKKVTNTITNSDVGSNEKAVEAIVKRLYVDREKKKAIAVIAEIARQMQTKQSMEEHEQKNPDIQNTWTNLKQQAMNSIK